MNMSAGSERVQIRVTVNGQVHQKEVEARQLLVDLIRETLGLTGTHIGCDTSNCGACTILLDGQAVKSCTLLAAQVDGAELLTIEGMEQNGQLHPLQEGFWQEHGLQCGFCTPGMILAAKALLDASPDPSEAEIRRGISGNLCRCTGYVNIVKAIQRAGAALRESAGTKEAADV